MPKKQPKRGPGRPPIENPKDVRINFRCTVEKRDHYHAAAAASGLKLAEWMEKHLDRAAARAGQ